MRTIQAILIAMAVLAVALAGRSGRAEQPEEATFTVEVYEVQDLLVQPGREDASDGAWAAQERARLAELLRTVVRPGSWDDPRAFLSLRPSGDLTISQSPAGHQAVRSLLKALRDHRQTRITIQARLFTYRDPETLAIITSAMRLDEPGPARLVLDAAESAQLASALAHQPDVKEWPAAKPVTVVSGSRACFSTGSETVLSTRWRPRGTAEAAPAPAPLKVSAFEGGALLVQATATADGSGVILLVNATETHLAGGRPMLDLWGRIDLPEFAASTVFMTANVPPGHSMLVGGLKTLSEVAGGDATRAESPRRRPDAEMLILLAPLLEAPRRPGIDLEALAVEKEMKAWSSERPAPAAQPGPPQPATTQINVSSPDGLVTLDLSLSESDLGTPGVRDWLLRLFRQPGLRIRRREQTDRGD